MLKIDHAGIIIKVENDVAYILEVNSKDAVCRQLKYSINNNAIYGYYMSVLLGAYFGFE